MANNLYKDLESRKEKLDARFNEAKAGVMEIDTHIGELQRKRQEHLEEMNRLQGEHRLVVELLSKKEE